MTRQEAIENLTLALLYLTRFGDGTGQPFNEIAWKNYDFDAIDALDSKDLVVDPRTSRGHAKYVYLTESGRKRARELLSSMEIADREIYERFEFRNIKPDEAEDAAAIEQICFPPNEACSHEHMLERISAAPETFLVAIEKATGKMTGFINGIATDDILFRDDFFTDASLHNPEGRVVMILGLDVLPEYRKQGLGRELVYNFCRREQEKGRRMLVLTCLANKVKMYKRMGFRDRGESNSTWGGERWHGMDIILRCAQDDKRRNSCYPERSEGSVRNIKRLHFANSTAFREEPHFFRPIATRCTCPKSDARVFICHIVSANNVSCSGYSRW